MADAAAVTDHDVQLILDPKEELVFRGPFHERCSCHLLLTNSSSKSPVAFKMKCTAARYYASSPAVGVIPPQDTTVISVFLSELTQDDLAMIVNKKHRFGITYLPVATNCTNDDVDRVLKESPKDVKTAYLQSIIIPEGEDYVPGQPPSPSLPHKEKRGQNLGDIGKPPPPKPSAKPVRRYPLGTEDSLNEEIRREMNDYKEQNPRTKRVEEELTAQIRELNLQLDRVSAHETELQRQLERLLQEKDHYLFESLRDREEFMKEKTEMMDQQIILEEEIERLTQENKTFKQSSINTDDVSFWEISRNDIEIHEQIGSGAWGYVARGTYKEHPVAVKCLHDNLMDPNTVRLLRREIAVMAKVRHPCLLLFIGVSFGHSSRSPMIVTELMDCSLRDTHKDPTKLNVKSKVKIMMDVACALHYLHTHKDKILHRDVSSANVLLVDKNKDNIYRGKLSDFGSANFSRFATTVAPGAIVYMAPEVLSEGQSSNGVPQTSKIDVYSYGILLCEVFTQNPQIPLNKAMLQQFIDSVKNGFNFVYQQIEKCIRINPDDRPEIVDVLKAFRSKFPNL